MACFRSIVSRSNILRRMRRSPALAYSIKGNDENETRSSKCETHIQDSGGTLHGVSDALSHYFFSSPTLLGPCFSRHMSSATNRLDVNIHSNSDTVTEGLDIAGILTDGTEVFTDVSAQTVATHVPVPNEIAIAAADSAFPVAALQYIIDAVHSFTGFNWWASIALTTFLIRGATIPILINQLKATQKLSILRPRLQEIQQNPQGLPLTEVHQEVKKLFNEHGVTPFTPLKGLLIQGPIFISFFFAISNMSEKVPSMKHGGTSWFGDLTTPDTLYIFPVLTALTFWLTVEFNSQEGMEGNSHAGTIKNVSRIFALASVPLTMSFPKAIFCYWVTSNIFSLTYGFVMKVAGVKKFLGISTLPPPPPTATPRPSFNLYETIQQARANMKDNNTSSVDQKKSSDQSVTILNQRIRSLEKQVKAKRKNKKI